LDIRRKYCRPGHPLLASPLLNLAQVLAARGEFAGALPLLREYLEIRGKTLPPGGRDAAYFRAQCKLGECLTELGRFDEAEQPLLESLDGLQGLPEISVEQKQRFANCLVHLYKSWNKPEQAAAWRTKAAAMQPAASQ